MSLNLYTYKPTSGTVCNDDFHNNEQIYNKPFYIQGVLETLNDTTKSKFACFLELKREQLILLQKLTNDLLYNCTGNYYKNHVLLDAINLYSMYTEEFDNDENAFDIELTVLCRDMVLCLFELFSCTTNICVLIKNNVDRSNPLVVLLQTLENLGFVTLIRTVLYDSK
ncbi:p18 [Psilogramma increta granulovirus]|uniref:P18 n=1 Tax=Psilogramma increta granulovirus TaxID=2953508 RepID=A0A977XU80_9BBAC|nr:p18 [Psilogramma increta granulovirus]